MPGHYDYNQGTPAIFSIRLRGVFNGGHSPMAKHVSEYGKLAASTSYRDELCSIAKKDRSFRDRALIKIIKTEVYVTNFDPKILAKTYLESLRGIGGKINTKRMINAVSEALAGGSPAHIAAIVEFLTAVKAIANLQPQQEVQQDSNDDNLVVLEENNNKQMLPEDVRRAGRFVEWVLNDNNKIKSKVTATIRRVLREHAQNDDEKIASLEAVDASLTTENQSRISLAREYKTFKKGTLVLKSEHSNLYNIELLSWGPNDCANALQLIVKTQDYIENFNLPILAQTFVKSLRQTQGNRGVHDSKGMIQTISQALQANPTKEHVAAIIDLLMEIKQIAETSENADDKRRAARIIAWVLTDTNDINNKQTLVIRVKLEAHAMSNPAYNNKLIELIASISDHALRKTLNQTLDQYLTHAINATGNLDFLETENPHLYSRIFNSETLPQTLLIAAANMNDAEKSFALALKLVRILTPFPDGIAAIWRDEAKWTDIAKAHGKYARDGLVELLAFEGIPEAIRNELNPSFAPVAADSVDDDAEQDLHEGALVIIEDYDGPVAPAPLSPQGAAKILLSPNFLAKEVDADHIANIKNAINLHCDNPDFLLPLLSEPEGGFPDNFEQFVFKNLFPKEESDISEKVYDCIEKKPKLIAAFLQNTLVLNDADSEQGLSKMLAGFFINYKIALNGNHADANEDELAKIESAINSSALADAVSPNLKRTTLLRLAAAHDDPGAAMLMATNPALKTFFIEEEPDGFFNQQEMLLLVHQHRNVQATEETEGFNTESFIAGYFAITFNDVNLSLKDQLGVIAEYNTDSFIALLKTPEVADYLISHEEKPLASYQALNAVMHAYQRNQDGAEELAANKLDDRTLVSTVFAVLNDSDDLKKEIVGNANILTDPVVRECLLDVNPAVLTLASEQQRIARLVELTADEKTEGDLDDISRNVKHFLEFDPSVSAAKEEQQEAPQALWWIDIVSKAENFDQFKAVLAQPSLIGQLTNAMQFVEIAQVHIGNESFAELVADNGLLTEAFNKAHNKSIGNFTKENPEFLNYLLTDGKAFLEALPEAESTAIHTQVTDLLDGVNKANQSSFNPNSLDVLTPHLQALISSDVHREQTNTLLKTLGNKCKANLQAKKGNNKETLNAKVDTLSHPNTRLVINVFNFVLSEDSAPKLTDVKSKDSILALFKLALADETVASLISLRNPEMPLYAKTKLLVAHCQTSESEMFQKFVGGQLYCDGSQTPLTIQMLAADEKNQEAKAEHNPINIIRNSGLEHLIDLLPQPGAKNRATNIKDRRATLASGSASIGSDSPLTSDNSSHHLPRSQTEPSVAQKHDEQSKSSAAPSTP